MNQNNKQYNNYYVNVIYEGKHRRLYNELTTDSYNSLYSETQIKLIELIENFNLDIFYISCKSKLNSAISFIELDYVNLNDENVIKIKKLLSEDMYYLYKNQLFEVIYKIPKLNEQSNYSFDMILVVNKNFNLNKLYNYNFNLIKIQNIQPINVNDITYDWIESIFKKRSIFNNCIPINDKFFFNDYYDITKLNLSSEDFIKNYNNNVKDYELDQKHNASSPIFYGNFNQNLYAKNCFRLLDVQIWSLDRNYIRIKNKFGSRISYLETYEINSVFITNFAELIDCNYISSKLLKNNEFLVVKEHCYYSTLSDSYIDYCITENSLNKESIKTGFADISNLELKEEWEIYV